MIYSTFGKRVVDLVAGTAMLVAATPILGLALVAIILDSPGSPIFTQTRAGKDGKPFRLLKLRTMTAVPRTLGAEIRPDSPGVTRVGRILRHLRIDEMPQLLNVIRGEMSLVGPRPILTEQARALPADAARRHTVRPGLTGLAQVCGNTHLPWPARWSLDAAYAQAVSLPLDLAILALTGAVVLLGESRFVGAQSSWFLRPWLKA